MAADGMNAARSPMENSARPAGSSPRHYTTTFLRMRKGLCSEFSVDAEMLLYVGDADFKLKALIDFVFLELGQLGVEAIDFRVELVDAAIEARFDCGKIVLGRHVLDHVREHISEFIEGRFLWRHGGCRTSNGNLHIIRFTEEQCARAILLRFAILSRMSSLLEQAIE
jgi:hypothetical protein